MNRMSLNVCYLALVLGTIAGCTTSSGITPDGTDGYRIMITGDTGFTNSGTLQKEAYAEASDFCVSKGKAIQTLNMDSKQARPLGGWPEATLYFRCVDRAPENQEPTNKKDTPTFKNI